jgi:putative aldouronate transport system substrate-binding protein
MKKLLVFMLVLLAGIGTLACTLTTTTPTTTGTTGTTTTTTTSYTTTSTTPITTTSTIDYETEVTLNVAINYKSGSNNQFITFQQDTSYTSAITLDTYSKGDLLPVWEAIGEKLNINFVDQALTSDGGTAGQWTRQSGLNFAGLDLINGTGANIAKDAVENGNFVDMAAYLDSMPNLKAFLEANPSVRDSITASDGGIYYTPYFDGFGEQEQMFLMRIDWVEDILDVVSPTFDTTAAFIPTAYTRQQMPDSLTTNIVVANADGTTRTVEKSYTTNILDVLKALVNPTGADIANAFRTYMTATYGDQDYAKLSDVFVGTDAAYDTDELIALMYVIKSNPLYMTRELTTPLSSVNIYIPRTKDNNRIQNFVRGMEMYGLRGVFSKCEFLYFDEDGVIQDVRHEEAFVDALNDLVTMSTDGLIPANLTDTADWVSTALVNSNAFMMYDYNNTQTQNSKMNAGLAVDPTYSFQCVLPPVVDWLGTGTYFHFTESVRSVKGEAWGIVYDASRSETELYRILKLVDEMYDYSSEDSVGTIHLYGPVGFTDGTIEYGTDTVYKLSDAAKAEMATLGKAMIDYLRIYVGATMPIGHIRSLGLEYQTLSTDGIEGVERLNTAAKAGVMLLAGNVPADNAVGLDADNPWFKLSPTTFPLTKRESLDITTFATFRSNFEAADYPSLVAYGFTGNGGSLTEAAYWATWTISDVDVYEEIYIKAYRDAYSRLLQFMEESEGE